jgi:peptidoglycan-N-acetylglucosamine deacetylase
MDDPRGLRYYIRGRSDGKRVALTFDDGPNPPRTEQILGLLEASGVRATFFLIGKWVERWPRSVERMMSAGHVIGNHSYTHAWHVSDYDLAEAAIAHVTGRPTTFVRAASFDYNACALSPTARSRLVIDADVNPGDCFLTEPDDVYRGIVDDPHLGPGSIIDLHDGAEFEDHAQRVSRPLPTILALPRVIKELERRGFEFVGLDEFSFDSPLMWQGTRDPQDIVRAGLVGRPEILDNPRSADGEPGSSRSRRGKSERSSGSLGLSTREST